ncbi:hypothetical protein BURCENBC7_AP0958, partial [Burkholderia cenocepacia BC7]
MVNVEAAHERVVVHAAAPRRRRTPLEADAADRGA